LLNHLTMRKLRKACQEAPCEYVHQGAQVGEEKGNTSIHQRWCRVELQANIKKHIRRWQLARAYHTTEHYHKNLSLRPWSKLGKCSLNKSINLFGSVLSLMCGWSKLGKCSLNKSSNLLVSDVWVSEKRAYF
jgi:hypothetical protein